VAEALVAAHAKGDATAIRDAAGKDDPDPWEVVDELFAREARDVARAFAAAVSSDKHGRLAEYAASPAATAATPERRDNLLTARKSLVTEAILEFAMRAGAGAADVVGVQAAFIAAGLLRGEGRLPDAAAMFRDAADGAEAIGWIRGAAHGLDEMGHCLYAAMDRKGAVEAWTRALPLYRRGGRAISEAGVLVNLGRARRRLGDVSGARETFREARQKFEALGDAPDAAGAGLDEAETYAETREVDRAFPLAKKALAVAEAEGLERLAGEACSRLADLYTATQRFDEALAMRERAVKAAEKANDAARLAIELSNLGNTLSDAGRVDEASASYRRALAVMEANGDRPNAATTATNLGVLLYDRGEFREALRLQEHALEIDEGLGVPSRIAHDLVHVATTKTSLGDYDGAEADLKRALAGEPSPATQASAHLALGLLAFKRERFEEARAESERAIPLFERVRDPTGVGAALTNLVEIHRALGENDAALRCATRAMRAFEATGDRLRIARVLLTTGNLHADRGDHALAMDEYERAGKTFEQMHDPLGTCQVLSNLAMMHARLGDPRRALELAKRADAAIGAMEDRVGALITKVNLAMLCREAGDADRASALYEEALREARAAGYHTGESRALAGLARLADERGEKERSVALRREALEAAKAGGDLGQVAMTTTDLSTMLRAAGRLDEALDVAQQAVAKADAFADRDTLVKALHARAAARLARGDAAGALADSRRAVEEARFLFQRLSDEEGSRLRSEHAVVYEGGLRAAAALSDAPAAAFFLESGRAGSLLEQWRSAGGAGSDALPPDLWAADVKARHADDAAARGYRLALAAGDVAAIQARRADLDRARAERADVLARIQRAARSHSDVVYPSADSLDAIAADLPESAAFVEYGRVGDALVALVATRTASRLVALGPAAPIAEAAAALRGSKDVSESTDAIARLRAALVAPLALAEGTKQVLVSPAGEALAAPFPALLPGADVVLVPSGTAHRAMRAAASERGEKVVAFGDPDYGRAPADAAASRSPALRGGRLAPLPATAAEAKAVGDVVFLGKDATEANLRDALAKDARWRAVHLACHGLVDVRDPSQSALALTPSGEDDGFFSLIEVFRRPVRADLVVLSACDTGRGTVYPGEGLAGLARGFLFAGAPRVICSLWRVDDEASGALLTRFYALWNPKDGSPPLPTASALRAAQEFVRAQEKWKDPVYWAGWVLWGLGD
jgi:tetratricopeptide (TPR) repeat protein